MSIFDAPSFLAATLGGANATRRKPLPIGETFGQIEEVALVDGEKNGNPWAKLNVTLNITDMEYLQKCGREVAKITAGIMLDLDNGAIAMGDDKNARLGRLREATGTNLPGKSLLDMKGTYVRFQISHRPDEKDPDTVYDEPGRFAKM